MNLEKQVCSLELAKKLKELGVEQDSLWYWVKDDERHDALAITGAEWVIKNGILTKISYGEVYYDPARYSAFTVAELGEMLPENCSTVWFKYEDTENRYWESLYNSVRYAMRDTEADARAQTLIHLIQIRVILSKAGRNQS